MSEGEMKCPTCAAHPNKPGLMLHKWLAYTWKPGDPAPYVPCPDCGGTARLALAREPDHA